MEGKKVLIASSKQQDELGITAKFGKEPNLATGFDLSVDRLSTAREDREDSMGKAR